MREKVRPRIAICTAGHVDHGKSSVVFALTGSHPEVPKSDNVREVSIQLGFAKYGSEAIFIDMPAHEKHIESMLAGTSAVEGVLMVVAADDGVMPQTREHVEILKLLGIKTGVIAITKVDLAEKDWIDIVRQEIRALIAGTLFQAAPIVPVSTRTGEGIAELKRELDLMIRGVAERPEPGLFRMWIDQAINQKGVGTAISGILLSGVVRKNDRIEIFPAKQVARVKQVIIADDEVESGQLGDYVTLAIPGINKETIGHADMAAQSDHYLPTQFLNTRLSILQSAPRQIEDRTRLRLHIGFKEYVCRVATLDKMQITPGGSGFAQLRLEEECVADFGDKFIVRSHSEGKVIGGGDVLEVHPPKMKLASAEIINNLVRLESGQPTELVRKLIQRKKLTGVELSQILKENSLSETEAQDIVTAMLRDGEVVLITPAPKWFVVDARLWRQLKDRIVQWLSEFHASLPELSGARRSETKARVAPSCSAVILDKAIESLVEAGLVALEGDLIRLEAHSPRQNGQPSALRDQLLDIYKKCRFVPVDPKQLATEIPFTLAQIRESLDELMSEGAIIKLIDAEGIDVYFHQDAIDEARQILLEMLKKQADIRFFEFRERLGSTRRYTTPLAILFDEEGITYREGSIRKELRGS